MNLLKFAKNTILKIYGQKEELIISGSPDTDLKSFSNRIIKHTQLTLGLLLEILFLWLTELIPLSDSSLLLPVFVVALSHPTMLAFSTGYFERNLLNWCCS